VCAGPGPAGFATYLESVRAAHNPKRNFQKLAVAGQVGMKLPSGWRPRWRAATQPPDVTPRQPPLPENLDDMLSGPLAGDRVATLALARRGTLRDP
jgi:hypothetical protein